MARQSADAALHSRPPHPDEARDPTASLDPAAPGQKQLRLTLASTMVGTALEWYDFYLYGTAAALVFNHLFFPSLSPLTGTLAAFTTYGIGFLVRPLGGLIFGTIGDRYGRRPVLVVTLLMMGLSTMAIGCLPSYASIGMAAPVLLTVLRMVQGLGAGAEFGSAITLCAEKAPAARRGFFASWSGVGIAMGVLLSAGAFALVTRLPQDQFLSWGWRVPFLASLLAVIIGIAIRLYVTESPVFKKLEKNAKVERLPIVGVWQRSRKNFLVAIGARIAENTAGFFFQVWSLSYITNQLHVKSSVPITGVMLGSAIGIATIPMFGTLSDRIGRKPVYMGAAILMALGMFPYFWLLNTREPWLIIATMVVMISIVNYSMFSVQAAYFVELFDSRSRVSGISMSRELSAVLAGGLAPVLSSLLLVWSGGRYASVAVYMIVAALITVVALMYGPETRGRSLDD